MALNKYMHPRNIYKTPPDFAKLAEKFTEFSRITKVDLAGNVAIDFKDPKSLRILTKCLLKSDFDLEVQIPEERLVPTLPLRLNYVLWIEDLLKAIGNDQNVRGLDIGTGACAIYPLLASVKNKWHMVGTETDEESLSKAEENVQRNNLQDFVQVKKNETASIIDYIFSDETEKFHFSMCNPPFYSNIQELCESRSIARPPPKNGFTGSPHELITEGGELEFCRKMITESQNHKNRVIIFSTMVGHKFTLEELLEDLKKVEGVKYTHTEFCQGRVTRWGIAWTYENYDIYKLLPPRRKLRKKSTSTVYQLPELKNYDDNIETVHNKLRSILQELHIAYTIVSKRGTCMSLNILATENNWSNQRRKRRLMKRQQLEDLKKIKLDLDVEELTNNNSVKKSEISSVQTDNVGINPNQSQSNTTEKISKSQEQQLVHAFIKISKKEKETFLEADFLEGSSTKEGLHQIIQYIKNNWK